MLLFGWSVLVRLFSSPQSLYQFFGDCIESTNYNWYHRHFHVPYFFQFPSKVQVFIFLSPFFSILLCGLQGRQNPQFGRFPFLLIFSGSGRLTEMRWPVCISKSRKGLCVSFSRTDSGLYIYHLFVWSHFNALYNSQWINFPIQSCLILYSFCACLLHSLIMWLIVSSITI